MKNIYLPAIAFDPSLFYPTVLALYDIPPVLLQNCKHHLSDFLEVVDRDHVRVLVNAKADLKFSKQTKMMHNESENHNKSFSLTKRNCDSSHVQRMYRVSQKKTLQHEHNLAISPLKPLTDYSI